MTRTFALSLLALAVTTVSPLVHAQARPLPEPRETPPALVVARDGAHEPLALKKVDIDARIVGYVAETRMTMTFYNPHSRPLAGDLYFPLPQGATVSGYALDVDGVMVDGVVVTKEKARRVFEAEVRKGVDPGLVEWTAGHNFQTRVFPIPARGTRTVMVRYVSELVDAEDGPRYHLPLSFRDEVGELTLRVEVLRSGGAPRVVSGGPRGLDFGTWRDGFVTETNAKNIRLTEDLTVALPKRGVAPVWVEKSTDGHVYFAIRDAQAAPTAIGVASVRPRTVRVYWDTSWSRAKSADLGREKAVLLRYLGGLGDVAVELVPFDIAPGEARRFSLPAHATRLGEALDALTYDGGTQLAALDGARPVQDDPTVVQLLFTDGVSNYGQRVPDQLRGAVYIVNSASTADHALMRLIAQKTGGAYFNLKRLADDAVVTRLGVPTWTFASAATEKGRVAETYPQLSEPVSGPFTFVGRLDSDQAKVTLRYGWGGVAQADHTFTVLRSDAVEGHLLRRLWAGKKLEDLLMFPERNADDIVALGKAESVVTPGTSLIVLERLDQYVEHDIRPPASLGAMRTAWDAEMEARSTAKQAEDRGKLDHVLELWKAQVAWWEQTFEYPKNFRYGERAKKKMAMGSASARPARVGSAPGAPMPEEAASADMDDEDDGFAAKKDEAKEGGDSPEPGVAMRPWEPDTPYMRAIKAAKKGERYAVYLHERHAWGGSPAFFLDCSDYFHSQGDPTLGHRVLSNVAELGLEDPALLRVLAHRLAQLGALDEAILAFEEVLRLRPEEPQSFRDLALVLERRGDISRGSSTTARAADYRRALDLLADVVMNRWDRFDAIEVIALTELNHILPKAKALGLERVPLDERLIRHLDMDVRIVMTWDADMTDMDLHVVEPSTEEAYYSHNRTTIGGKVSRDFTQGYGPETYSLRRAMRGMYEVKTKFFGSSAAKLQGAVTLQVDVFTHYGRDNEKRRSMTLRLTENKETFTVGELEF